MIVVIACVTTQAQATINVPASLHMMEFFMNSILPRKTSTSPWNCYGLIGKIARTCIWRVSDTRLIQWQSQPLPWKRNGKERSFGVHKGRADTISHQDLEGCRH